MQEPEPSANPLFTSHPREFEANRYVYAVLSRRAGGISIGVNLNPDKRCNFRCVYCQVDRSTPAGSGAVDLDRLAAELDRMVELVALGEIFGKPPFSSAPPAFRRLNDIALSGDGEPTLAANFEDAVERCAEVRRRRRLTDVKLVLITNAALFHLSSVRRALNLLDASGGEIWAKLDAGNEDYYRRVDRSNVPWQRILDNLREAAVARPIVIQSLFMRLDGQPPTPPELRAYCDRLEEILAAGGQIKLVQIHTIARKPAEASVAALADLEVNAIVALVRRRTGLPAEGFCSGI